MRWEDERYVRLYTRDTPEWIALGWEAQSLLMQLMRKCDRAGILELGRVGTRGLSVMLRMPIDVTEKALNCLLEDGCVAMRGTTLVILNFLEAQEAIQSNKLRKERYNERQRDKARALEEEAISQNGTRENETEQNGTPNLAVPSRTDSICARRSEAAAEPTDQSDPGSNPGPLAGPGTPPSAPVAPQVAPDEQEPVKAKRVRKKQPEAECPGSDASGDEVKAWLAKWKINGVEVEIAHFLDHHRSKGNVFRDWGAAWRTWQRNGVKFGRASCLPGSTGPTPPAPTKPIDERQLFNLMDHLKSIKPGEHVR